MVAGLTGVRSVNNDIYESEDEAAGAARTTMPRQE